MAWLLRSATKPATSMTATVARLALALERGADLAGALHNLIDRVPRSTRAASVASPDLDLLHRVADEVASRLADVSDWGPSGRRDGQYAVDVVVDDVCVELLTAAGLAVLSEESGRSGDGDRIAVVDPLDGSTNASRGIPWFATSLCLVDEHGPAVALVANQATGERLEAVRGQGAWIGGRRLVTSGRTSLDGAIIGVSGLPPAGSIVGLVAVPGNGRGRSRPRTGCDWRPRRLGGHERARPRVLGLPRPAHCCARRPEDPSPTPSGATSWLSTTATAARRSRPRHAELLEVLEPVPSDGMNPEEMTRKRCTPSTPTSSRRATS